MNDIDLAEIRRVSDGYLARKAEIEALDGPAADDAARLAALADGEAVKVFEALPKLLDMVNVQPVNDKGLLELKRDYKEIVASLDSRANAILKRSVKLLDRAITRLEWEGRKRCQLESLYSEYHDTNVELRNKVYQLENEVDGLRFELADKEREITLLMERT